MSEVRTLQTLSNAKLMEGGNLPMEPVQTRPIGLSPAARLQILEALMGVGALDENEYRRLLSL